LDFIRERARKVVEADRHCSANPVAARSRVRRADRLGTTAFLRLHGATWSNCCAAARGLRDYAVPGRFFEMPITSASGWA